MRTLRSESDFMTPLRRATPADAPAVRQLVRDAYARWVPIFGREPSPMTADYDVAVRLHEVDLAYMGGDLVALVELIVKPDHLFIENIAVAPDRQGQGLGRRLIAHAEARARELGLPSLQLLTGALMQSNLALYQSLGFQIDRQEPFLGGFDIYLSKDLAAL
jgi:GNAT superfamily N-acetyltransferase